MSIRFEISTEPELLKSYYHIRQACFRKDLGLSGFDGSEDQYDRLGSILIARDGDHCIGGMRISGSTPQQRVQLPVEHQVPQVRRLINRITGPDSSYCQWTRLAILSEYRSMELMKQLCEAVYIASTELGYQLSFNIAGHLQARLYKQIYSSLGYDHQIAKDIQVNAEDGFDGLPHQLSVTRLQPLNRSLQPKIRLAS